MPELKCIWLVNTRKLFWALQAKHSNTLWPTKCLITVKPGQVYPVRFYEWVVYLNFESVSHSQACISFEKNQWPLVNNSASLSDHIQCTNAHIAVNDRINNNDMTNSIPRLLFISKRVAVIRNQILIWTLLHTYSDEFILESDYNNRFKLQIIDSLIESQGMCLTSLDHTNKTCEIHKTNIKLKNCIKLALKTPTGMN